MLINPTNEEKIKLTQLKQAQVRILLDGINVILSNPFAAAFSENERKILIDGLKNNADILNTSITSDLGLT
jgi:hypothetical protein